MSYHDEPRVYTMMRLATALKTNVRWMALAVGRARGEAELSLE